MFSESALKWRILIAANNCLTLGNRDNIEYVTLLDAVTGAVIPGYELKRGEYGAVSIAEWRELLINSPDGAYTMLHNHNNGSMFSYGDIKEFLKYDALLNMFLATGKNIGYMCRLPDVNKNVDWEIFRDSIKKEINSLCSQNSEMSKPECYCTALRKIAGENGIYIERWDNPMIRDGYLTSSPVDDGLIDAFNITEEELRPYREGKTTKDVDTVFREIMAART